MSLHVFLKRPPQVLQEAMASLGMLLTTFVEDIMYYHEKD